MRKVYMVCYFDQSGTEFLTEAVFSRRSAAESHAKLNNRALLKEFIYYVKELELL